MTTAAADVCVVGGGPAGLAAAIAARQQGLSVVVVEAGDAPADKCCGEGLMPDGVAALRILGVAVPSDAARFQGIRFIEGERDAVGNFAGGTGAGIRRTRLHQLLLDRALELGVDCRFQTRVTGLSGNSVALDGGEVRSRWIVGADGYNSAVRKWSGLNAGLRHSTARRFGFRRHFQIDQAPDHVEVHWHDEFQVCVTPVGADEVTVAMIARHPDKRLDYALERLPHLRRRLGPATSTERGGITGNLALPRVHRGNIALVGDASGAADSISGEGLCLAFREAVHLGAALAHADLGAYAAIHPKVAWPARAMARLLVTLAAHPALRRLALGFLQSQPAAFQAMLSAHGGEAAPFAAVAARNGLS